MFRSLCTIGSISTEILYTQKKSGHPEVDIAIAFNCPKGLEECWGRLPSLLDHV